MRCRCRHHRPQVLREIRAEYVEELAAAAGGNCGKNEPPGGDAPAAAAEGAAYAARAVPQLDDNLLWIGEAESHKLVVGSQARILYANAAARVRIAAAFNGAIAAGRLSGPVVRAGNLKKKVERLTNPRTHAR